MIPICLKVLKHVFFQEMFKETIKIHISRCLKKSKFVFGNNEENVWAYFLASIEFLINQKSSKLKT